MPSFAQIPSDIRVPLTYFEFDPSAASTPTVNQRTLLIGPKVAAGSAVANTPVLVSSDADAMAKFGRRSVLRHLYKAYAKQDPYTEIWGLPVDDNGAGVPAAGTFTVTGPATAAGTIVVYIAGTMIPVAVANGDVQNTIATNIAAAITAEPDVPVTAGAVANVVTVTAANDGTMGNSIGLAVNYQGSAAGEAMPAGVAVAVVAMAAGATNPALATAIANMGDTSWDFVVTGINDATNVGLLETEVERRWDAMVQVYGHLWFATTGNLAAQLALNYDSGHTTNVAQALGQSPSWDWGGAYAGQCARSLRADPARPCQFLELIGIWAPSTPWTIAERQQLLENGSATHKVNGAGAVLVEREITTYQTNAAGSPDAALLDVQSLFTTMTLIRELRSTVDSKYGRHKLVNDDAVVGAGQAVVKPKNIRAEIVSMYRGWELRGLVENTDAFKAVLVVERNGTDPNRLDVLLPPDLANQLRIFAALVQPRLQFPAA